jgi:homoserine dehydrogenase
MAAEAAFGVGLIGLGTVGGGVLRVLRDHGAEIDARLGFPLRLRHVADLELARVQELIPSGVTQSRDWKAVVADPTVDVVVELIGGTGVAREVVLAALAAGKGVVTANKALLARHGREVHQAAERSGSEILFEASVAGTIPVLRALREGLCADRILSIHGIVNGTCNFILTEMNARGESYAACLARAQQLGYAEADPSADVDGGDSAHKLAILLGLALGVRADVEQIPTRGIRSIDPLDLDYARRFGFRIKLLASAKRSGGGVEARVEPVMIPEHSVLARIDGSMNALEVRGAFSGPTLYCGAGAGSLPSASAVAADVMELARNRRRGPGIRVPPLGTTELRDAVLRAGGDSEGEFYLRFSVVDEPGVLHAITGVLSGFGISIASILQPERHQERNVPVVIVTHATKESELRSAVAEIERLPSTSAGTQVLRIEREL